MVLYRNRIHLHHVALLDVTKGPIVCDLYSSSALLKGKNSCGFYVQ